MNESKKDGLWIYLGNGVDMAKHPYEAYQDNQEIHIVYPDGYVASEKIKTIQQSLDEYLWTPYIEWIYKCKK